MREGEELTAQPAPHADTDSTTPQANVVARSRINPEAFRYAPNHAVAYGMALGITNPRACIALLTQTLLQPRLYKGNAPRYSSDLRNEIKRALHQLADEIAEEYADNGE